MAEPKKSAIDMAYDALHRRAGVLAEIERRQERKRSLGVELQQLDDEIERLIADAHRKALEGIRYMREHEGKIPADDGKPIK